MLEGERIASGCFMELFQARHFGGTNKKVSLHWSRFRCRILYIYTGISCANVSRHPCPKRFTRRHGEPRSSHLGGRRTLDIGYPAQGSSLALLRLALRTIGRWIKSRDRETTRSDTRGTSVDFSSTRTRSVFPSCASFSPSTCRSYPSTFFARDGRLGLRTAARCWRKARSQLSRARPIILSASAVATPKRSRAGSCAVCSDDAQWIRC